MVGQTTYATVMINGEGSLATKTSGASIGSIESGPSLGAYYNASQLRADTWSRLKVLTGRLERHDGSSAAPAELRAQAEQALILLGPVESYWAFPGHEAFNQLRRLFEREDYPSLSRAVNRIVRALMSNAYRRKTVPLGISGESEDEEDDGRAACA